MGSLNGVVMRKQQKTLAVIPTYNEKLNINGIIPQILAQDKEIEILVVDDASPDGTAEMVRSLARRFKGKVHLLQRPAKMGLGTAYVAGFQWGLKQGYGRFIQMDADWSHDPKFIPSMLEGLQTADFVLGTRYQGGRVSVVNWPIRRLILSQGANFYVRMITGLKISDCTGGFKAFHRNVLENIGLEKIRSDGYSFQVEVNYKAVRMGFRFQEVPIIFIDRTSGSSKMSPRVIREAVWKVWAIRLGW
jgi:dolichol-phosphate mannosyltransferase